MTFALVWPQDSFQGEQGRMEHMVKASGSKNIWMSSPSCRMSAKQVGSVNMYRWVDNRMSDPSCRIKLGLAGGSSGMCEHTGIDVCGRQVSRQSSNLKPQTSNKTRQTSR